MERLPECVLLRILTGLPLRYTLRVRVVCKAWNALLQSSQFLQTLALQYSPHPHLSCFVMAPPPHPIAPDGVHHSQFSLFIPALGIWLHSHFILPSSGSPMPALDAVMPSAAHRNLVAISTPQVIRVFHLLTSSHYDIAPLPHLSLPPVLESTPSMSSALLWSNLFIFCDDDDESYQLVLSQQRSAHHTLFIYSSKLQTWRAAPAITWIEGESQTYTDIVDEPLWNTTVGSEQADLVFWNSKHCMLVTYCIESNKWNRMRVFSPMFEVDNEIGWMQREYLAGGTVFECTGGRVVLVCAEVMDERLSESSQLIWRQIKGFRVWDLERVHGGLNRWMEVASAPASFWEAYYSYEYGEPEFRPKFIHDGTCICMTSAKHISSQRKSVAFAHNKLGRYKPPLVYDLHLKSWSYLPRYSEEADDLVGLFTFKSSLTHLALHNSTRII